MSTRRGSAGGRRVPHDPQVQLAKLYADLPTLTCQGLCHVTCVTVPLVRPEQQRIQRWHGVRLPMVSGTGRCQALSDDNRCTVYEDRPLICRLWGLVPSMRCPFGCEPEGGFLTAAQGRAFSARLFELSGDTDRARAIRAIQDVP